MTFTCVTLVVTMLTKANIIASIESIKTPILEVVAVALGYVYSLGRNFLSFVNLYVIYYDKGCLFQMALSMQSEA